MSSIVDDTNSPPPLATRPHFVAPAGACDCHCHVFGPYDQFPLAADRTYGPPQTPVATYIAMLDTIGFDRGVLVQPSAMWHVRYFSLDYAVGTKRLSDAGDISPY